MAWNYSLTFDPQGAFLPMCTYTQREPQELRRRSMDQGSGSTSMWGRGVPASCVTLSGCPTSPQAPREGAHPTTPGRMTAEAS